MKHEKPRAPKSGTAPLRVDLTHAPISERRLWHSLDTLRDGFAIYDAADSLVAANSAYMSVFKGQDIKPGSSYAEVLEALAHSGLMRLEDSTPQAWVAQMLARRDLDQMPDHIIHLRNGRYVKLVDRRTDSGDIACLNVDVTENMRLCAGLEALPDGFVIYDEQDQLEYCNRRYREIYADSAPAMTPGASFEEILRYGLERGQYKAGIGREEDWLKERLSDHRDADTAIEQKLSDGRWLRIMEQRTPDGGLVGLRVDITEQKRQQEALEKARVESEAAARAKSSFLANMSHELRTPMNGVVGMADLLCETELSEEQKLYAETIRNSGEALLTLINDVLDFAKMDADKLTLYEEPFDLERMVHDIVTLLGATARDKELDLCIDYDMFLPTNFKGDRGRIRQVLTNLIGNAVKFTEQGHVLVRVVGVETSTPGVQQIHMTVEDTGIGIAPEKQAHIFGEFNQVDDQQNRKFEGTGLGLAISKRLVEMMGGEVWLESEKGKGACFGIRLTMPLAEPAQQLIKIGSGERYRVLLVHDQRVNRSILDRQLSQLGLEVVKLNSGAQVLKNLLRLEPFDMVITDHLMPDMDGLALAEHLRRREVRCPIILLSSDPAMSRQDTGQDGVNLVLTTPTVRRTMYQAISALLSGAPVRGRVQGGHRNMRVLAAEDNRTNALVLRKMVQDFNIDMQLVQNGQEALEAFLEQRPDLILMDISMPVMDGKQATREIRAVEGRNHLASVPIVALTAHAMNGEEREIMEVGMTNYLTKPLRKERLLRTLYDYLPPQCHKLQSD